MVNECFKDRDYTSYFFFILCIAQDINSYIQIPEMRKRKKMKKWVEITRGRMKLGQKLGSHTF